MFDFARALDQSEQASARSCWPMPSVILSLSLPHHHHHFSRFRLSASFDFPIVLLCLLIVHLVRLLPFSFSFLYSHLNNPRWNDRSPLLHLPSFPCSISRNSIVFTATFVFVPRGASSFLKGALDRLALLPSSSPHLLSMSTVA